MISPAPVAMPAGAPAFSAVLRDSTKTLHREAERAGFVADLLRARATRAGYALFLRNLQPAYAALEPALKSALAWHQHPLPALAAFADPRLARLEALEADLSALAGSEWRQSLPVLPPARAYAAAIVAVADQPVRLVAHAYARYLGDLSGGQILRPLLARTLGLEAEALTFYDFPLIADLAASKAAMREGLDLVGSGGSAAAALVEEALAAFAHNISVSEAVQAALVVP